MGARCIWGAEERFKSDVFDCVIQAVLVMRPLEPDLLLTTCYTVLSAVHAVNGQEPRGRIPFLANVAELVYCTCLENRRTRNRSDGSNPSIRASAGSIPARWLRLGRTGFSWQYGR